MIIITKVENGTPALIVANFFVCALNDEYSSFIKKPKSESLLNAGVVPGSFSKWQAENDVRITDVRMGLNDLARLNKDGSIFFSGNSYTHLLICLFTHF